MEQVWGRLWGITRSGWCEMPILKRVKTKYPGVYFIEVASASGKIERIFYIRYRKNGKLIEEKAGRQFQDDMSPARAAGIRFKRIEGDQLSNNETRKAEITLRKSSEVWTIEKLFREYINGRPTNKARATDQARYNKYLQSYFGKKQPQEIIALDVDRLRINLAKKLSPQTVKHILNLLSWIINFGVKKNLCAGLNFHIQKPSINNVKTEDLTPELLGQLLYAIEKHPHPHAGLIMKMALFTGMRRGELFKLKWEHIDIERGFIQLKDPKGGPDQKIPINNSAMDLLERIPKNNSSSFVFPGKNGGQRTNINKAVNEIKAAAGLPKDFRPLHGLRHVFASMLASSGQVDMYTLQKLLTHKDPKMTQRYAHLRDETLKKASSLAGELINEAVQQIKKEKTDNKG